MSEYRKPACGQQLSAEQVQTYVDNAHQLRSDAIAFYVARLFTRARQRARGLTPRPRVVARKAGGCVGRSCPA